MSSNSNSNLNAPRDARAVSPSREKGNVEKLENKELKQEEPETTLDSAQQVMLALEAALEKKALDPVLIDVSKESSYTDYILVLSGRSDRHVQSVADGVLEAFARLRIRPVGVEGKQQGQWTLLDFGDFIVHVFYHPNRDFYDLEGLWCDAPRVAVEVPPEARASHVF